MERSHELMNVPSSKPSSPKKINKEHLHGDHDEHDPMQVWMTRFEDPAYTQGMTFGGSNENVLLGGTVSSTMLSASHPTVPPLDALHGGKGKVPDVPSVVKINTGAPTNRTQHAVLTDPLTRDLFLSGGRGLDVKETQKQALNDLWRFSHNDASWENITPVPQSQRHTARYGHTFTLVSDTIAYVYGGMSNTSFLDDVFEVDVSAGQPLFKKVRTSHNPKPRYGHAAVATKDQYLFICGGLAAGGEMRDCHFLDLQTKRWRELNAGKLSIPLAFCSSLTTNAESPLVSSPRKTVLPDPTVNDTTSQATTISRPTSAASALTTRPTSATSVHMPMSGSDASLPAAVEKVEVKEMEKKPEQELAPQAFNVWDYGPSTWWVLFGGTNKKQGPTNDVFLLCVEALVAAAEARVKNPPKKGESPTPQQSLWNRQFKTTPLAPACRYQAASLMLSDSTFLVIGGRRKALHFGLPTELCDAFVYDLKLQQWRYVSPEVLSFGRRAGHTLNMSGLDRFLIFGGEGVSPEIAVETPDATETAEEPRRRTEVVCSHSQLFNYGFGQKWDTPTSSLAASMRLDSPTGAASSTEHLAGSPTARDATKHHASGATATTKRYVGCHFGIDVSREPILVGNIDLEACAPLPVEVLHPQRSKLEEELAMISADAVRNGYKVDYHGTGDELVIKFYERRLAKKFLLPWLLEVRQRLEASSLEEGATPLESSMAGSPTSSAAMSPKSRRGRRSRGSSRPSSPSAASPKNRRKGTPSAEEELKDDARCYSCDVLPISMILRPCGHFCTCDNCANSIVTCPLCDQLVTHAEPGISYKLTGLHDMLLDHCNNDPEDPVHQGFGDDFAEDDWVTNGSPASLGGTRLYRTSSISLTSNNNNASLLSMLATPTNGGGNSNGKYSGGSQGELRSAAGSSPVEYDAEEPYARLTSTIEDEEAHRERQMKESKKKKSSSRMLPTRNSRNRRPSPPLSTTHHRQAQVLVPSTVTSDVHLVEEHISRKPHHVERLEAIATMFHAQQQGLGGSLPTTTIKGSATVTTVKKRNQSIGTTLPLGSNVDRRSASAMGLNDMANKKHVYPEPNAYGFVDRSAECPIQPSTRDDITEEDTWRWRPSSRSEGFMDIQRATTSKRSRFIAKKAPTFSTIVEYPQSLSVEFGRKSVKVSKPFSI